MARRSENRALAVRRTALIAILAVFLFPLVWLLSTAYKPARDIFSSPPQLLFAPTMANFESVFRYFDLVELLKSSLIISLGSTLLSLALGVPAGYALARARFRGAVGFAYFFLAVRAVPPVATLIPFYLLMRDIGLLGTWWAVVMLNTALNSAFVVWISSHLLSASRKPR
jgi:multiple sugar transport system permease protein